MANPARKAPVDHPDEAVEILRRLEPVLVRIEGEQREQRKDITKLREDVAELKGRITGVDGRLSGIEGQLRQIPTIWTLAALIFAIFGASFVLIRFASGH